MNNHLMSAADLLAPKLAPDNFMNEVSALRRSVQQMKLYRPKFNDAAAATSDGGLGIMRRGYLLNVNGNYIAAAGASGNINNTTTETEIFRSEIPSTLLLDNNFLWWQMDHGGLNDTGSNRTATMRFKFGSTTMATIAMVWPTSGDLRWGQVWCRLGKNLTDTQDLWAYWVSGIQTASDNDRYMNDDGNAAETTADPHDFVVTIQHSTNSPSLQFYTNSAVLLGAYEVA